MSATAPSQPMPAEASPGRQLVDRRVPPEARVAAIERARTLPRIDLDRNQVLDLEKIANGTFSPLEGFLGSAGTRSVVEDGRLPDGSPWTIPVNLQVPAETARRLRSVPEALLWDAEERRPAGTIEIAEVFRLDLARDAERVWGTTSREHPGVARFLGGGEHAVAGPIRLLEHSTSLIPGAYDLDPERVRAEIRRRGWRTVTGFQTRNLAHRAHERLQKTALEITDGLLIHPLIGWKKPGDMLPEVILDGYAILIERYYPAQHVMLAALTTAMRYAGPREAVFHALIRRNFGCTHFIVGRDHAGVGAFYAKYAAHRAFDRYTPGELGIVPLLLHGPCWCDVCQEVVTEKTCPHGETAWKDISGTELRAMIGRGERPPAFFMRPEIADFLIERARRGPVFF
jgi:sulfate adenylyltransferase